MNNNNNSNTNDKKNRKNNGTNDGTMMISTFVEAVPVVAILIIFMKEATARTRIMGQRER